MSVVYYFYLKYFLFSISFIISNTRLKVSDIINVINVILLSLF